MTNEEFVAIGSGPKSVVFHIHHRVVVDRDYRLEHALNAIDESADVTLNPTMFKEEWLYHLDYKSMYGEHEIRLDNMGRWFIDGKRISTYAAVQRLLNLPCEEGKSP